MARISTRGAAALFSLALCASGSAARALESVTVGATSSITDLPFFIAEKRGYFTAEGLDVKFVNFDSAARMIAPLASGDLDVASGGPSAALYNAIARGVGVRIVADRTTAAPGRYSQILLVRKALVDSGRVKTIADLKGLRLANAAPGSSAMGTLNRLYKMAGLKEGDIEKVYMSFPQQIIALENGATDLAMPTEPYASEATRRGFAVPLITDDKIYPGHQIAVMIFSDAFRAKRGNVGVAFIRAYIRAVRDQNAALVNGRLAGPGAEEFISLIAENTSVKDKAFLRTLTLSNADNDGKLNMDSLKEDFEVFRAAGLIEGKISVDEAVDSSFTTRASAALAAGAK